MRQPLSKAELEAALKLLRDDDVEVVQAVIKQLQELGPAVLEAAQRAAEGDPHLSSTLGEAIGEMKRKEIPSRFEDLIRRAEEDIDLEEATFLLASWQYPNLERRRYEAQLDNMAAELRPFLTGVDDPIEIAQIINRHLFGQWGFRGNTDEYYDAENSYINRVLDRRLGIPITLSAVYLFLTRRLDFPVEGVGMPGHFILRYKGPKMEFFIDAFNQGQILARKQCVRFLKNAGYGDTDQYLEAVTDREILSRMIRNLILIYAEKGQKKKAAELQKYLQILQGSVSR